MVGSKLGLSLQRKFISLLSKINAVGGDTNNDATILYRVGIEEDLLAGPDGLVGSTIMRFFGLMLL